MKKITLICTILLPISLSGMHKTISLLFKSNISRQNNFKTIFNHHKSLIQNKILEKKIEASGYRTAGLAITALGSFATALSAYTGNTILDQAFTFFAGLNTFLGSFIATNNNTTVKLTKKINARIDDRLHYFSSSINCESKLIEKIYNNASEIITKNSESKFEKHIAEELIKEVNKIKTQG